MNLCPKCCKGCVEIFEWQCKLCFHKLSVRERKQHIAHWVCASADEEFSVDSTSEFFEAVFGLSLTRLEAIYFNDHVANGGWGKTAYLQAVVDILYREGGRNESS